MKSKSGNSRLGNSSGKLTRSDLAAVQRIFDRETEIARRPATDEQLALIWPLWNALPSESIAERKRWILTGLLAKGDTESWNQLEELKRRFPKTKLPLDRHEFNQALDAAMRWSTLTKFVQTTFSLHQNLVTTQWAFAEADSQASGRIAIFRTAREIEVTHPGLLQCSEPTLQQIQILASRYAVYLDARKKALDALARIVFKVPDIRIGTPLPFKDRAAGVPHPPDDVPRHLYIARLKALGICSPDRLAEFMNEEFPKLNPEKRREFSKMSRKPQFGKDPYAALLVWVLDNRPVFEHEQFRWQWLDIEAAAQEKKIPCPKTVLKQWANRHSIKLKMRRGPTPGDDSNIVRSTPLLSPAPVFGAILHSSGNESATADPAR